MGAGDKKFLVWGMWPGVELVHMVWVGGGIKKTRGLTCQGICTFQVIIAVRRGQGQGLRDWGG